MKRLISPRASWYLVWCPSSYIALSNLIAAPSPIAAITQYMESGPFNFKKGPIELYSQCNDGNMYTVKDGSFGHTWIMIRSVGRDEESY